MTVLAIDIATRTGFAILRADGSIESGVMTFAIARHEHEGHRFIRFRHWLMEVKHAHETLERIAFENVVHVGEGQAYAAQLYGGFRACMLMFCAHHGIPQAAYNVGTIKKAWTGQGNAKKDQMVARCKELGFNPRDDNEADAIALLHLACDRVPSLPTARLIEQLKKKKTRKPAADKRTRALELDAF
jgi:Holliday junction resolvasome RuvABC endonuclease subunit